MVKEVQIVKTGIKIPLAKPKVGVAGKTGFWRITKPVIDYDKCVKCFLCEIYCPVNVIRVEPDQGPVIDYDYCKGCGVCVDVCPTNALKLVQEE